MQISEDPHVRGWGAEGAIMDPLGMKHTHSIFFFFCEGLSGSKD